MSRPAGGELAGRSLLVSLLCVLGALLCALLLDGYSGRDVGSSTGARSASGRAASTRVDAPILLGAGGTVRSAEVPPRTVVLTVQATLSPSSTRSLLRALRRDGARATFFVPGARAAAEPGLARDVVRSGLEVGIRGYTDADPTRLAAPLRRVESAFGPTALAGATGVRTALVRPPGTSTVDRLTAAQRREVAALAAGGRVVVLADRDARGTGDADALARQAVPPDGRGAVVLLGETSGGTRAAAVVERLLPLLRERGYRIATVDEVLRVPAGSTQPRASVVEVARGRALVVAVQASHLVATVLGWLLVPVALLVLARTAFVLALARRHVRRRAEPVDAGWLPPVTVVVPAYNEARSIEAAVRSLATSDYPDVEIIVVDDGSDDGTADVVRRLGLPRVRVVEQRNAGKPAALNTGIRRGRHDVLVLVDADTVFESGTLRALVQPLRDPAVGAVSGNTKVGNRRSILGVWQHIEYVVGFNLDRRMFDVLRCMPTVPGAIGAFRRAALADIGGVGEDTLAEDTDLTMALQRAGWRVVYEQSARAWTEAPADLASLWRQRYRWCYGTMQAMWKHRRAVLERGAAGSLGRRGLTYLLLFQVLLPVLAPAVDAWALYGLVFLDPVPVVGYWVAFTLVQAAAATYAFRLDGERLWPLLLLPTQQVVYRQVMYAVVLQSVVSALAGTRLRWHKLRREGTAGDALAASR